MLLYLLYVMALTLLNFSISCWLDIAYRTCCTIFGCFLTIIRIQILVLFISSKAWFSGLLFVDWEIYDMLSCLQYFTTILMVVYLCGKLTLTSNILYLMKGWSEMSIFNFGRVEIFSPIIISEPDDYPLPNLLLCLSNFADKQYLGFLVCGSHYFIVYLLLV